MALSFFLFFGKCDWMVIFHLSFFDFFFKISTKINLINWWKSCNCHSKITTLYVVDSHLVCAMISNIDHPGNFPFHTLLAPTVHQRSIPGSNASNWSFLTSQSLIIPLLGNSHSLRYFVYSRHYTYAHLTVNIDPSTPLCCRDSDASQWNSAFLRLFALFSPWEGRLPPLLIPVFHLVYFPSSSVPVNDWSRRSRLNVSITSVVASWSLNSGDKICHSNCLSSNLIIIWGVFVLVSADP